MKPKFKTEQFVWLDEHPKSLCKILKVEPFRDTYYYHLERIGITGYNTCQEFEHSLTLAPIGKLLYE